MNRVLLQAFKVPSNVTIDIDPSDLPELQADLEKLVAWLKEAHWLTPNEKRDFMGEDKYPDPLFDEPWIPTGHTPLSQLGDDGGEEILKELQKYTGSTNGVDK